LLNLITLNDAHRPNR